MIDRVYPRSGTRCWKRAVSPKRSEKRTRKPLSTWSDSSSQRGRARKMRTYGANSTGRGRMGCQTIAALRDRSVRPARPAYTHPCRPLPVHLRVPAFRRITKGASRTREPHHRSQVAHRAPRLTRPNPQTRTSRSWCPVGRLPNPQWQRGHHRSTILCLPEQHHYHPRRGNTFRPIRAVPWTVP